MSVHGVNTPGQESGGRSDGNGLGEAREEQGGSYSRVLLPPHDRLTPLTREYPVINIIRIGPYRMSLLYPETLKKIMYAKVS